MLCGGGRKGEIWKGMGDRLIDVSVSSGQCEWMNEWCVIDKQANDKNRYCKRIIIAMID